MTAAEPEFILPDWPASSRVHAVTTTRRGGVSLPPYDTFNLAAHVGDDAAAVAANRARLTTALNLPAAPVWLQQVHGTGVVDAGRCAEGAAADGAFVGVPGVVCAVLTADCLPVLLCDRAGTRVAALHAGWRGLAAGVLEAGVDALGLAPADLLAWLGPAIGPEVFEVGEEVRAAFMAADAAASAAFRPSPAGRWLADLYRLAHLRLAAHGVSAVYGGGLCTFNDPDRFYSFRRERDTGRMASLIWLEP